MPLQRQSWNAVVRASWNPAILTPRGVGRILFGLPPGTPVEVRVPLDGLSPYQVHHEATTVIASADQLLVEPDAPDWPALAKAMALASRAIAELPVTPFTAAGFNVRFRVSPTPDELVAKLHGDIDNALADQGIVVNARKRVASWPHGSGVVNLEVNADEASATIALNFHRGSDDPPLLRAWLETDIAEVQAITIRALKALSLSEDMP